jgi:putative DNA primase/helicase
MVAKREPTLIIEWVIPKGYIVIETKETNIIPALQGRNAPVMVARIKDTLYIYGKSTFDRTTVNNVLACGITANTYAYNKSGTTITLPFRNKKVSTEIIFNSISIPHSHGIDKLPNWLRPMRKISSQIPDGLSIPIESNEKTILINQLSRIKSLPKFEQEEIIGLINTEFCANPITSDELKDILAIGEDMLMRQFFDKNTFFHNKLGDYVIEACNIKRDSISKELFYYNERKNIYMNDEAYIMGYMTKLCPLLKDYQKQETVKYILNYLYDETVEFNSNPYVVVFKNGILDLTTMTFEDMNPQHLESIMIDCEYDPNAYSATADEFFRTATNGNKETETLLYEAIGYSMLKTNALQKAFMLIGTGRNGKSTYLDLCKSILGKGNYASVSFKDLSNNFRASGLIGKLASFAGDISSQPIQDSDLFKSIAAGEEVTLEEKYKAAQTLELFSTMFYACNKLPRTPDTSDGFYRRWVIIPFSADLTGVSAVDGMTFRAKLLSTESRNYVAYKAVQAIKNVLDNTLEFTEPAEVKEIKRNYRIDNSTVLSWFKENFGSDIEKLRRKRQTEAYLNYTTWCEACNRSKSSRTTFLATIASEFGVELST